MAFSAEIDLNWREEISEFTFDTLEEVQKTADFNDIIEFEENGEKQLGFYIGDGYVFLLEKVIRHDVRTKGGVRKGLVTKGGALKKSKTKGWRSDYSKETIDVNKVKEFKSESDYKKHKYKVIKRKQIPWNTLSNITDENVTDGEDKQITDVEMQNKEEDEEEINIEVPGVKEHDVVEIEHPFGIKHFALCTQNGKAIDLSPITTMQALGKPLFSSCIRGDHESDNYGINEEEPMRFANGLIRERPLAEIIEQSRYRIRDDFLTVKVVRKGERTYYQMKPLPKNEIRENIDKAKSIKLTRYNICRLNCEHFVMFLKYGACVCSQTQKVEYTIKRLFIPVGEDAKDEELLRFNLTAD